MYALKLSDETFLAVLLKKEFEEWDKLSDEAFLNFEGTL